MGTATARLGPRAGAKRIGASGGGRSGPRHGPGPGHLHLGSSFSLPRADISGTGVNRGTGVSGGGAAAHMKAVTGESRVATASAGTRAEGRARNHLAALLRHVLCAASRPVTTVSILDLLKPSWFSSSRCSPWPAGHAELHRHASRIFAATDADSDSGSEI